MPKDEFDFEDPLELNGVGIVCPEDTTETMTECFVEEFLRLGHNARQIMALFLNPHYVGMHMALKKRGEPFVRDKIAEVFARWGRAVSWTPNSSEAGAPDCQKDGRGTFQSEFPNRPPAAMQSLATDPLDAPAPPAGLSRGNSPKLANQPKST